MSQSKSPFKAFDDAPTMGVGSHLAELTSVEVVPLVNAKDEQYDMLKYVFTNERREEAYKWAGATWSVKSKVNRPFVAMLSGSGIPQEALTGAQAFWDYTLSLVGTSYNISVVMDDKLRPTVAAAMPTKGITSSKAKAASTKKIAVTDDGFEDDEVPF